MGAVGALRGSCELDRVGGARLGLHPRVGVAAPAGGEEPPALVEREVHAGEVHVPVGGRADAGLVALDGLRQAETTGADCEVRPPCECVFDPVEMRRAQEPALPLPREAPAAVVVRAGLEVDPGGFARGDGWDAGVSGDAEDRVHAAPICADGRAVLDIVRAMPIEVTVEMPFDWIAGVLVPAVTILVSAGIAIWVASFERKRSETEAMRNQAGQLIRALSAVGDAFQMQDSTEMNRANSRLEQEINVFAAHLRGRDVAVAKWVAIVVSQADDGPIKFKARVTEWVTGAIELWLRGELKTRDFKAHMPRETTIWIENIDLGDRDSVLRGAPARGIPDFKPLNIRKVSPRPTSST